jgi:O-methyltransferase involved in polyketide biosynthesis
MSEIDGQDLSGVAETLLITLYLRAIESQRPDALIKDEKAVALVAQMSYDFALGQGDPAERGQPEHTRHMLSPALPDGAGSQHSRYDSSRRPLTPPHGICTLWA